MEETTKKINSNFIINKPLILDILVALNKAIHPNYSLEKINTLIQLLNNLPIEEEDTNKKIKK